MRKIIRYPNSILKTPTLKVDSITKEVSNLIADMQEIVSQDYALGLAANQVGSNLSVFLAKKEVFINPVILEKSGKTAIKEGCLSFPGLWVKVRRARNILVKYMTAEGAYKQQEFSDLDAIVVQHEMDHLRGLTFLDRIPPFKKKLVWNKYRKFLDNE